MSNGDGLPRGWANTFLENIVEIHDDLREPVNAEERASRTGPYPYYGATGQVGWIDGYLLDGQYVLLGEDGAPFLDPSKPKAYMIEGKCWVNNHAHVLRGTPGICENRYLLYALNHADYRSFANGTTRLKLTQGAMRRIPLRLAPFPQQRRIVAKIEELFSDLDAGVMVLERAKAKLKRYRAAVLKAAVEGKLTEEWHAKHPPKETASQLLERILKERRRKWEENQLAAYAKAGKKPPAVWENRYKEPAAPDETNLPALPDGWCWATLDYINLAERPMSYGVLQPGPDLEEGVPLVRVCDVADGKVAVDQLKRISPTISENYRRTILRGGEVLLTIVGTIGRTAVAPDCLRGANTARAIAVIPISSILSPQYVEIVLRETGMRSRLTLAAHEVARKTLNLEDVRVACIPLPPLVEQAQIIAEVERRLSIAQESESQVNANLTRSSRLRQSILKLAFEGRLLPQDPNDEPASLLLERIKATKKSGSPKKTTKQARKRK